MQAGLDAGALLDRFEALLQGFHQSRLLQIERAQLVDQQSQLFQRLACHLFDAFEQL